MAEWKIDAHFILISLIDGITIGIYICLPKKNILHIRATRSDNY